MKESGDKEALRQWEARPALRAHPSSSHWSCGQPDAGSQVPVSPAHPVGPLLGPGLVLKTLSLALRPHDIIYI